MSHRGQTLLLLLPALAGCAASRGAGRPDSRHVDMDPMHFVARRTEAGLVIDHMDAEGLFRRGGLAFEEGRAREAVAAYETLLAEFPGSPWAPAARYNLGLSYQKLGRYLDAIRAFGDVLRLSVHSRDASDALFRIAGCYEALEDWPHVVRTLEALLRRPDLLADDRVEARVRLGGALLELGRLDDAERELRAVLERHKRGPPRPLLASSRFLAQAQHGLARVEHLRFSAAPIRLPEDVMARDIEAKASTFLRAQAAYLRAMSFKDRYWSSASGLGIGALYEDFYNDLMAAPIPPEIIEDAEAKEVYFEELRKVIRPLVQRAIYVYEKNTRLASGLGADSTVLQETESRLDRLRKFLETHPEPEEAPADSQRAPDPPTPDPQPETG